MSALLSIFQSRLLADVAVAVDACDGHVGAGLAAMLAEFGAMVRLRGEDIAALQDLRAAIVANWGRAEIAPEARDATETTIKLFASTGEAIRYIRSAENEQIGHDILVITAAAPDEIDPTEQSRHRARNRQLHAILSSPEPSMRIAPDALAALVLFLLSPAGREMPGQCFRL